MFGPRSRLSVLSLVRPRQRDRSVLSSAIEAWREPPELAQVFRAAAGDGAEPLSVADSRTSYFLDDDNPRMFKGLAGVNRAIRDAANFRSVNQGYSSGEIIRVGSNDPDSWAFEQRWALEAARWDGWWGKVQMRGRWLAEQQWPVELGELVSDYLVWLGSTFDVVAANAKFSRRGCTMKNGLDPYAEVGAATTEDLGNSGYVHGYSWVMLIPAPAVDRLGGLHALESAPIEACQPVETEAGTAVVTRLAPSPHHVTRDHLVAWRSFLEPVLVPRRFDDRYRISAEGPPPRLLLADDWIPATRGPFGKPIEPKIWS